LYVLLFFYPPFFYGVLILAVGFLILLFFQLIHFSTQYCGDTFRNNPFNKVLITIALLVTILALAPFLTIVTGYSVALFLLFFYSHSYVGTITFLMAWLKLRPTMEEMVNNGTIGRHNRWLYIAALGLIVLGNNLLVFAGSILGFNYIFSLVGLMLFLHPLRLMKKNSNSKVLNRIFGAAVAQAVLGSLIILIYIIIISIFAASNDFVAILGSLVFGTLIIILLVLALISASLFMPGYWIGDLCCKPREFLGDLESGGNQGGTTQGTEMARPTGTDTSNV
jgi:hypothetical protein